MPLYFFVRVSWIGLDCACDCKHLDSENIVVGNDLILFLLKLNIHNVYTTTAHHETPF